MGAGGSKHKHGRTHGATEPPSPPGKPYLVPGSPSSEPDVITIRWEPPEYNGGAKITGYLVEHRRTTSPHWVRSTPLLVRHPSLTLSGLEPGMRYQFRVCAENELGRSEPSPLSEAFAVSYQRTVASAPFFSKGLADVTVIENEKVQFTVQVQGTPTPKLSWFKDGFEVFSNRRQRVAVDGDTSTLIIHQAAYADEGEIKCTATNKAGHAITKARLILQAPPSVRLPRQYEEGLLFELGEKVRLKVSLTGRPPPKPTWIHNGEEIVPNKRYEISVSDKFTTLRINEAMREDRGEYQVKAINDLGEDIVAFLVTVTDRPSPPGKVNILVKEGRNVTLGWTEPHDDGGCKIGSYIVEYYRIGWDMWLKAAACRQLTTTISDLIEGSEYKFRVKAENPYGLSEPSEESDVYFIPDPKRGLFEPPGKGVPKEEEGPEKWMERRELFKSLQREEGSPLKQKNWDSEESEEIPHPVLLAHQVLRKVKMAPKRGWSEESTESRDSPEREEIPVAPKRKSKLSTLKEEKEIEEIAGRLVIPTWRVIPPPQDNEAIPEGPVIPTWQFIPPLKSEQPETPKTPEREKALTFPLETLDKDMRESNPTYGNIHSSSEMMLVLMPNSPTGDEKDLEREMITESLKHGTSEAPPMSLSAPELSSCEPYDLSEMRNWVSSSEIMYQQTLARFNLEAEEEEAEKDLKDKYGIERKRSFERNRASKGVPMFPSVKTEKEPTEEEIEEDTEDEAEKKARYEMFSERFQQLENSFKEYADKFEDSELKGYDFEDQKRRGQDDNISIYSEEEEIEEQTYHPRNMVPTKITVIGGPGKIEEETPPPVPPHVSPSPTHEEPMEEDISSARRSFLLDDLTTDEMAMLDDVEIVPLPEAPQKIHQPPNPTVAVPKPILKVRESSTPVFPDKKSKSRSKKLSKLFPRKEEKPQLKEIKSNTSESSNEAKTRKKVRIEEPGSREEFGFSSQEERSIGMHAGEVARNRRKLSKTSSDDIDPTQVVISHYSDIVKEYGQGKKPPPKLYLNYEELKAAAEKSNTNSNGASENKTNQTSNQPPNTHTENHKQSKEESKHDEAEPKSESMQVVVYKPPIDPEIKAYTEYWMDVTLFLFACWVYLFKDPLYVIPLLVLLMYRQLYDTINAWIPESWGKKPESQ